MSEQNTELVDVRLPRELVERLCSKKLLTMLETAWFDAFSRGAEFGMTLITTAQAAKKKARKKRKPSPPARTRPKAQKDS